MAAAGSLRWAPCLEGDLYRVWSGGCGGPAIAVRRGEAWWGERQG